MNGCEEWEELLLQYRELEPATRRNVDVHLVTCPDCRDFLEALDAIDLELTGALSEVVPAPGFDTRVKARTGSSVRAPRPGLIEALDGIGWLSMAGILALVTAHWAPAWATTHVSFTGLNLALLQPLGVALFTAALVFGLHTWHKLAD